MAFKEFGNYDAVGLAELVRKKEVTAKELLDEAVARTTAVDPKINAVVVKHYDYAERQIAKGLPDGPFTGVPFLLKDLDLLEGTRTTSGASLLKDFVADHNGTLTQRFLNAGLAIFGKSASPEFGLMPTTESRLFGPTRNPWNLQHSSGGSSGGAGAAVAARILPVAHASDGGGSIRIRGEEVARLNPARIARLGVGYVPQGRRLWRSLTVDEHLALAGGLRRGAWTIERIYDIFPRLAERKNNGGNQLSGGEQQMLAISRALLTNPHLLIMDEPTEGLAPVIVAQVEDMLLRLGDEGDISVLVIEQNIGVATAVSRNVAIMVNGRINRIIDSARLATDRELQQRLLGVGTHGTEIGRAHV